MQLPHMQGCQHYLEQGQYLPLGLWRKQLWRRRLIVVIAWSAWDECRAHASSMAVHLAS
jgi:hypothetical protein